MKKRIIQLSLALFSFGVTNVLFAQDKKIVNWYNGGGTGMRTEKAYKMLKNKQSDTVVVAVIDSGIDIEHEDLKGKIWVNKDEIPDNGIDDDKNGYIDDVYGWNFLGNSKGENVDAANLERTRIYRDLAKKYEDVDPKTLASSDLAEYELYKKVKKELNNEIKQNTSQITYMNQLESMMDRIPTMVSTMLGKSDYTVKDLDKYISKNKLNNKKASEEDQQKAQIINLAKYMKLGLLTKEMIAEQKKHYQDALDYQLNVDFDERTIIGDNPEDFNDKNYGNKDVEGPDALHGTHVGGIIGAVRGNDLGGDGVAEKVLLMSVRTVPNGDENDKDVALAIRYAVDNGAQVINMSFGKPYSPHGKEVYEAFKYAESKGVLLIHAAGNDNNDIDTAANFPTAHYSFQKEDLTNILTIGASTRSKKKFLFLTLNSKKNLPADFSNYGQKNVDVFAPGFEIYNSVPQSDYMTLQGTSMAAPMVAGVAAMLKSYFPSLTMVEIKDIILKSAKKYKKKVYLPGTDKKVKFSTLSVTGGVVDVKKAAKLCKALEKSKSAH